MPSLHVAFTPAEPAPAGVQIVIDCIRATSTIASALAAGYREIVCVGEIDEALGMRGPGVVLGGERHGVAIDGFDLGNSPAEYVVPLGEVVVLTTTNGTRAILAAVAEAPVVFAGALNCLDAVARGAAEAAGDGDVSIRCAGVRGALALDDAYAAGRFAALLAASLPALRLTDAARAACAIAYGHPDPLDALESSASASDLAGTGHEADVARCAEVSTLDVAPIVTAVRGGAVSLRAQTRVLLRGGGG